MNNDSIPDLIYRHRSNANKLKDVLECGYATAWNKMKNPRRFTVGDLLDIDACGVVSLDELFLAIKEMKSGRTV